MDFSSFWTSLSTSFLIFVVLMLVFTWLSRMPSNDVIYYPNRILKGMKPCEGGRRRRSPFAWIGEAFRSTEEDLISMAGVDAAVYFVFLSTAQTILFSSCILLLPVLLPVAGTDNRLKSRVESNSNGTFSELDKFAMGNVTPMSSRLWAFLLATYWVSVVTFCILGKAYSHCSKLRDSALAEAKLKPEQYAILVRDIPQISQGQSQKEQVDSYFRKLHPETFYKSMMITDIRKTNKIWAELGSYRRKLARAEVAFGESKTAAKPEGKRPENRTGFFGVLGAKVDTIDYCNEKIKELLLKLDAEQEITIKEKQLAAALVFFNSKTAAASASQALHSRIDTRWTVMEAPEPRQLLWSNLPIRFYQRQIRRYVIYAIVFLAVVFYMIPIAFISAFTTLDNLEKLLPFLKPIVEKPTIETVLEAYLPQVALIVFLALLPMFLMFLSKAEGIPSESHVVRAASGKYFYFIVFNVFLGVTVGGTLFASLKAIEKDPNQIVPMLGRNLPKNATFFLTFVALRFFVGYGLELSRLIPLILYHLKKRLLCKIDEEVKEAWAPGDLGYATRVPNDMLIFTIVLCYSVIAPLIIPFGMLYFGLGWLVLRNQALKVYVPSYESYGRMWPHLHRRMVAALVLYQITMIGYFSAKQFYYSPLLLPLPIMSLIFAYVCNKRFYRGFCYTPLEVVCQNDKDIPNMVTIFQAYVPACLSMDKFKDIDHTEDMASLTC